MILVVDAVVGRHVAAALRAHVRELRRACAPVPAALSDLILATSGQARPTVDGTAGAGDHAGMDQLTVDYRGAADRLGVSDRSVRRLVAAGELAAVRVAGSTRIRTRDLESYVDALPRASREGGMSQMAETTNVAGQGETP